VKCIEFVKCIGFFRSNRNTLYVSCKFTYMMCEEEDRVGWFSVGVNSDRKN